MDITEGFEKYISQILLLHRIRLLPAKLPRVSIVPVTGVHVEAQWAVQNSNHFMSITKLKLKRAIQNHCRRRAFAYGGLLRLAPTWVPRSFFSLACASSCIRMIPMPTARTAAGIDERWFASTTEAANEGASPMKVSATVWSGGTAYVTKAVEDCRRGFWLEKAIWNKYRRCRYIPNSSITWTYSAPHAPKRKTSETCWPGRQA